MIEAYQRLDHVKKVILEIKMNKYRNEMEECDCNEGYGYNVDCKRCHGTGRAKKRKYRNKKITIDGHTFPSIKEGNRYCELKILLKAGEISELILQPSFIICPAVIWNGKKLSTRKYIADFQYCVDGLKSLKVIEDVKGKRTAVYMLKRSLFLSQYPEYDFREV